MRFAKPAAVVAVIVAVGATVVGVSSASRRAAHSSSSPPATVTATAIHRPAHSLAPGTKVSSSTIIGVRAFATAHDGFALADLDQGQYPVRTVDGGKTWRTNGPVLHLDAAQAPLVVTQVGAANSHTFFAFGGPGGGQTVDVTSDGGNHWWRAVIGDDVESVVAGPNHRLYAFTLVPGSTGGQDIWLYYSGDGGRHWHLANALTRI
jgi:hypothetical protein